MYGSVMRIRNIMELYRFRQCVPIFDTIKASNQSHLEIEARINNFLLLQRLIFLVQLFSLCCQSTVQKRRHYTSQEYSVSSPTIPLQFSLELKLAHHFSQTLTRTHVQNSQSLTKHAFLVKFEYVLRKFLIVLQCFYVIVYLDNLHPLTYCQIAYTP